MCYRPLHITNQSRHLTNGMKFELDVPCGKCYQCQLSKSSVYHLRSFYEVQRCLKLGGFVQMVTLTYNDVNLPLLCNKSDLFHGFTIPCFDYTHFRLFMVRLRKRLNDDGYLVSDNLRYFVTSEYGESVDKTYRPHYHLLLFCNVPKLDFYHLSKYVSDSWIYGLTDGVVPDRDLPNKRYYKSVQYVSQHTCFSFADPFKINGFIKYVTKYLEKQTKYYKLLDERFTRIVDELQPSKFLEHKLRTEFYKFCSQFHRQSRGYGLSALVDPRNSVDNIMKTGCLVYDSPDGCIKRIPLPQYFSRKLFYDISKSIDGSLHWHLNECGISYRLSKVNEMIDKFSLRCCDIVNQFMDPITRGNFNFLLGNRTIFDFSRYIICYKGRIMSRIDSNFDDLFKESLDPIFDVPFYSYQTSKDKAKYGCRFVSFVDIHDSLMLFESDKGSPFQSPHDYIFRNHLFLRYDSKKIIDRLPFCLLNVEFRRFVVDDTSDPRFEHFDTMFNILSSAVYSCNESNQRAYDLCQELRQLFNPKS